MTWTLRNNSLASIAISGDTRGLTFAPSPIPANGTATATEVIAGPAANQEISETVTLGPAADGTSQAIGTVTVAGCTGPEAPPDVPFAFANDANVETAAVGDTIDYTYCAENTSGVALEVVQVVDDRLGLLTLPQDPIVIAPGATLCSSDLGLPITHVVTANDAGATFVNNAVVTVRTVEPQPRTFQATDQADVEIQGFRMPPTRLADTGSNAAGIQSVLALTLSALGLMLVVATWRRAR